MSVEDAIRGVETKPLTPTKTAGQILHDLEGRLGEIAVVIETTAKRIAEVEEQATRRIEKIQQDARADIVVLQNEVDIARAEGEILEGAIAAMMRS